MIFTGNLDGNVRLETILKLGEKHGIDLPADNLNDFQLFIQMTELQMNIMAYFEKFNWVLSVFTEYRTCDRVACENVLDPFFKGIDYYELRFTPWYQLGHPELSL